MRIPAELGTERVVVTKEEKGIEIKIADLKPVINKELDNLLGITKKETIIVKNFEVGVGVESQSVGRIDDPILSDGETGGGSNPKGDGVPEGGAPNGGVTGSLIFLEKNVLTNPDYLAIIMIFALIILAFLIRKTILQRK